ncbi:unnamed protein product [Nippostrongylus brasiliensis]|uniref:Uncharacterized protein n=1 Tax=Nippostrongylus brasiliensis TaxID=27835 RepID=A0A3P6ZZS0_NIPBR|nr:unnamed protein product [Nippostrongylus brasiliensis]
MKHEWSVSFDQCNSDNHNSSDGLSEDEDCLRNGSGVSADSALAESTYDISTSVDMVRDATASTLQRETTPEEQSEPPSISSRSSNRSNLDAYLRRMSEDVSPALRTEMPHLIANEVAAKFAAKERAAANARQATTREQERPSSNSSSNAPPPYSSHSPSTTATPSVNTSTSTMYGGSVPSAGVRLHPMTSLRDQLHHFRKELNSGREDTSRVYPMSEGLPCYPRRLGQPEANVLDARGGSEIPRSEYELVPRITISRRFSNLKLNVDVYLPVGKEKCPHNVMLSIGFHVG